MTKKEEIIDDVKYVEKFRWDNGLRIDTVSWTWEEVELDYDVERTKNDNEL